MVRGLLLPVAAKPEFVWVGFVPSACLVFSFVFVVMQISFRHTALACFL